MNLKNIRKTTLHMTNNLFAVAIALRKHLLKL